LLELLRPPVGCTLDVAVGTTYSLDLISALMLLLSFAFFDWEHEDGELVADPLALLEALRRYGIDSRSSARADKYGCRPSIRRWSRSCGSRRSCLHRSGQLGTRTDDELKCSH